MYFNRGYVFRQGFGAAAFESQKQVSGAFPFLFLSSATEIKIQNYQEDSVLYRSKHK